jgi:hypothetical protein
VDKTHTNDQLLGKSLVSALYALAGLVVLVTLGCFAQSYRQLIVWALNHQVPAPWAYAWPAMLDFFVLIGETLLFVVILKRWPRWALAVGGVLVLGGFGGSLAANIWHLSRADASSRLTAAVAPIGAALGLAAGLIVVELLAADAERATVAEPSQPKTRETKHVTPRVQRAPVNGDATPMRDDGPQALDALNYLRGLSGDMPSARWLAANYLGGDPDTGKGGNWRMADRLIKRAEQERAAA